MRADQVKRIAVIGAGTMGYGIAQGFAVAGFEVRIHSRTEESLQRGIDRIRDTLQRLTKMGLMTRLQARSALPRIQASAVLGETVDEADVVIEAVYEDLVLKRRIFGELDRLCPQRTILASTTSTFLPSELASVTRRPDRVLVTHYINPPYLTPLVEVVRHQSTSDDTVATVMDLLRDVGKRPVLVQREVPGFISVRLQFALLREALSLVQSGVATPQDVDTVIKTSIGRRWAVAGVFEVLELAGWDLAEAIATSLLPHLENSTQVPQLLREKVQRQELGVKTGKGFYEWTPESEEALRARIAHAMVEIETWSRTP